MAKELIKQDNSKDILRNFNWGKDKAEPLPDMNFSEVLDIVDSDPLSRGAVNCFVDNCMNGGHTIVKKKDFRVDDKAYRNLEDNFMFRSKVLRRIFLTAKLFNNVFLELVKDTDGKTTDINILDSMNIKPITKANGDVIKYESKIDNPQTGRTPQWSKDEIVWYKFGDRSGGYAPVDLKAVKDVILSKQYVERYVAWLWQTGQFRILYNFKNASDSDIQSWVAYNRKQDNDFKKPFILKGDMEAKVLRDMKEMGDVTEYLRYLDNQILLTLRISPIDMGIPDASGRANSDVQNLSTAVHIKSWKQIVEDYTNKELFPKIRKGENLLIFKAGDRFEEKSVIENINIFRNMSMSEEAIREYMTQKRIFFKTEKLFDEEEEMVQDNDLMPSRFNGDSTSGNKRVGTGKESTTKESQLVKQSLPEISEHWYTN